MCVCRMRAPLLLAVLSLCGAALPDPPRGVIGARKYATNLHDCNGAVAFSSAGAVAPTKQDNGKLAYRKALIDKGIGWSPESGDFTCFCPGLYQFAFAGNGKTVQTRFVLKKKGSNKDEWAKVASTAGGGGANVVLLNMEVGDQAAIWLEDGQLGPDDEAAPASTFSGVRIAKKQ